MQEKKVCKNSRIKKVSIVGVIPSFAFQRAKYCALELHRKLPQRFPQPEIIGLLELDWSEKLQQWRQTLGREYWCLRRPVAVFFDDRFIGSDLELIKLTTIGNILIENIPRKNTGFIKDSFRKDYISYLKKTKRIYCYLDICVDDVYIGTLTFQLYNDLVPKTCENFKTLCLGTRGPLLSYKGSRIHRIVKKGWLQGGDIQYKTGGGGYSIFCDPLEDECFGISHDRRGVLSMANAGRNTNGSQFFITLKPDTWMDTHFVAFGQLIEGVSVLKILEDLETMYECPLKKVEIKNCGKLNLGDVEDIDSTYREEPIPKKKKKKFETISEQIIRLIMEALTEALKKKERAPDILDDGDVPSKMNIQLYFQGFYSLPDHILEESAKYFRILRRQLLREMRPSATEVVEVIMYDLLMAVLTKMTTLDDIRETVGHELYQKMVSGIDMKLELCQKPYVKRLVDQIVSTAESMVDLITKKLHMMKGRSENQKKFLNQMQKWIQSFVLQETFLGDNYFIADRIGFVSPKPEEKEPPKRQGKPCCEEKRKKKEAEYLAKLKAKYPPEDICCLGSKLKLVESEIDVTDFFSTCRYDLKRIPRNEEPRMPLLDLIEMSRYKLRFLRKQENRQKSQERICLERRIRKWMAEVVYTPETNWLKEVVFEKDAIPIDHIEEILYGAMTAGLLEMYYFVEEYMKKCGKKGKKLVTRTIYPEDSEEELVEIPKRNKDEDDTDEDDKSEEKDLGPEDVESPKVSLAQERPSGPPCPCGHPCCKCPCDPNYHPPTSPVSTPSIVPESPGEWGEIEQKEEMEPPVESTVGPKKPCASDETLVNLKELMAESISVEPEEIDIRSFRWLKPYILEKGCDLKTQFATQVHKWLEGDRFSYRGFISKHSLPTRASLLSLSFSLAELIKEENHLKSDIKNFIYDLWDLYFEEIFKEALLQYPPEPEPEPIPVQVPEQKSDPQPKPEEEEEKEQEGEAIEESKGTGKAENICKKILREALKFDFSAYCAKFGHPIPDDEKRDEDEKEDQGMQEEVTKKPEGRKTMQKEEKRKQEDKKEQEEDIEKQEEDIKKEEEEEVEYKEVEPPTPPSIKLENDNIDEDYDDTYIQQKEVLPQADVGIDDKEPEPDELVKPPKRGKSPVTVEELVDVSSSEESRDIPPYVLPFWVKFLRELTKQALAAIAKVSRLPRRLFFLSDTDLAFDEKMREWVEFNTFNPQQTKGREIMDFIAVHHTSLTNLEDTARSFLKKKKYSELINRCTRFTSADDMAEEIVTDVITGLVNKEEPETMELFVSDLVSSAVTAVESFTPAEDEGSDEYEYETDAREYDPVEED